LQEDVFYYVVCRFLRPPPAGALVARIEDVEYVILCSEKGAYGNTIERFDAGKLRSAAVQSDQFFHTTWGLPRAPGPSHKERIDPRLVWTRAVKTYTLPLELSVRKWGTRNGYGDTYEEALDEADAQTGKRRAEVVFIDSDSDDAGARADSGAGGARAGGSGAAASAARGDSDSESDPDSPGTQWRKRLSATWDSPPKAQRTACMSGDLTLALSRLYV
jgi:hypothetical protein